MVARTPPKLQHKNMVVPPFNPILLRETLNKVDNCMARLQELQYTVTGGNKVISGVTLSPRSTRGYLRTSLRCKQESLRYKNANSLFISSVLYLFSPQFNVFSTGVTQFSLYQFKGSRMLLLANLLQGNCPQMQDLGVGTGEWRRMSLPAMLLGETVAEIKQASQFSRDIVEAVSSKGKKPASNDPKTPLSQRQNQKPSHENSELRSRRKREKQVTLQTMRSESDTPSKQRAKSRINFKVSPVQQRECEKENCKYIANRVSPRNRPWMKKTVLFPNPLFHSSPTSQQQKLSKTQSPVIARNRQTPHKFLVKSPPKAPKLQLKTRSPKKLYASPTRVTSLDTKFLAKSPPKFQVKIRRHPQLSVSPTRATSLSKRSPKMSTAAKLRRSFSPSRLANKLASSPSKMRSFSPSRLASRLASPLKSKKSVQKIDGMKMMMSGLKQRPQASSTTSKQFSVQGM